MPRAGCHPPARLRSPYAVACVCIIECQLQACSKPQAGTWAAPACLLSQQQLHGFGPPRRVGADCIVVSAGGVALCDAARWLQPPCLPPLAVDRTPLMCFQQVRVCFWRLQPCCRRCVCSCSLAGGCWSCSCHFLVSTGRDWLQGRVPTHPSASHPPVLSHIAGLYVHLGSQQVPQAVFAYIVWPTLCTPKVLCGPPRWCICWQRAGVVGLLTCTQVLLCTWPAAASAHHRQ